MATTINWTYGLLIYFFMISIVTFLFSQAGVFQNNEVIIQSSYAANLRGQINQSSTSGDAPNVEISTSLKDVFSLFFWNISIYNSEIANYLWLIRAIFIYLPSVMLSILLYFALRSGSA